MSAVRVGVVGCGLIGTRRARVAAQHPGTTVEVVVDVREEAARALAAEVGCRWSTEWRRCVTGPDVDVIIASTPNAELLPVASAALQAGKSVLIEKPMGRNLGEALQLQRLAAESRGRLKVGFNHRHHPAIRGMLRVLAERAIGPVINARARYGHGGRPGYETEWRGDPQRAGGGELTDQGVHVVDLLQCINGRPREVFCMTQTAVWPVTPLEDNGFALLRYASGAVACFHTSWTQWKNVFSLEVFGTDGYLTVEGLGGSYGTETLTLGRRRHDGRAPDIQQEAFPGPDESWTHEWAEFVEAIISGGPYQGTPTEGVQVMQTLDALYQSARTGSVVAL